MINVDFVFGTALPCYFCSEQTAHGVARSPHWISVCKKCATSRTENEIVSEPLGNIGPKGDVGLAGEGYCKELDSDLIK